MTDGISGSADPMEAVLDKLRHIMRLARRAGTDGERQAAELAARRIADRHGIALESVEVGPDVGRTVKADEATSGAYRGCEFGMAAWIIREHFAVQVMFCVNRLGHGHLSWFGTRINIDVARYAFDILIRECRKHCRAARAKHVRTWHERLKFRKESFMRGWFHVINEKLTAHPLRNDLETFAAEKRRLEAAFDRYRQNNAVTDVRHRPRETNAWAVAAGMEAAQSVNLSRPCEGRCAPAAQVGRTLMLEAR